MEPKDYIVDRIEGEYAILKETGNGNEMFIALALLPFGVDIGTKLHFENFEYTVIWEKKPPFIEGGFCVVQKRIICLKIMRKFCIKEKIYIFFGGKKEREMFLIFSEFYEEFFC